MSRACIKCLRAAGPSVRPCVFTGSSTQYRISPFSTTRFQHTRPSSSSSSSTSSSAPSPKRPSPYRLIPVSTFLSDFAPLHVKGWRLDSRPSTGQVAAAEPKEGGMVELQDRRLVRRYDFDRGKEGWRDLLVFMQRLGEIVEAQDHHPSIHISPGSDYTSPFLPVPASVGYVLSVSTHTHTPMPPLKYANKDETMRPGVTGKDMKLAGALEEAYEGMRRR